MSVSFLDAAERGELANTISQTELQKFHSAAPTLNNTPSTTPQRSRNSSCERRKLGEKAPVEMARNGVKTTARWSLHELDDKYMGAILLTCFFNSGMIDAVSFNSWNCFVGMQTGNTIFFALGLGGQPRTAHNQQYFKSVAAILSFCVGALFFNFLHRWPTGVHNQPSSRRRILFILSFSIQTIFIIIPAILVTVGLVSNQPFVAGTFSSGSVTGVLNPDLTNYIDLIPICMLSFQAAGQVCLSRLLAVVELPSIVLSTLYHDFTADLFCMRDLWQKSTSAKDFFLHQARRQEKRVFAIFALFLGGVIGGETYKSRAGMAGALWFAAGIKFAVTIAFALWRREKTVDGEE